MYLKKKHPHSFLKSSSFLSFFFFSFYSLYTQHPFYFQVYFLSFFIFTFFISPKYLYFLFLYYFFSCLFYSENLFKKNKQTFPPLICFSFLPPPIHFLLFTQRPFSVFIPFFTLTFRSFSLFKVLLSFFIFYFLLSYIQTFVCS